MISSLEFHFIIFTYPHLFVTECKQWVIQFFESFDSIQLFHIITVWKRVQPFRTPHRILKHCHRSTLRIGFKVVAWISEAKRSRARVWKVSRLERMVKTPTIGKHRRSAEPVLPILSSNNVFRTRNLVSSVETYSSSHGRNNTSSRFYLIGS